MCYGIYSCMYYLVWVAKKIAPSAIKVRLNICLSAPMRSLVNVDAIGNRSLDVYTPDETEFDATNAWKQNFDNGNQNNNNKNNSNYVRAVRK